MINQNLFFIESKAMVWLGLCLKEGNGCEKNIKKAVELLESAVNLENPIGIIVCLIF